MPVLLAVVAAFAAIVAISRWQQHSAQALGKVSAVVSATAAFAEAWSKTHVIASKLASNPTLVQMPVIAQAPAPSTALARREPDIDDDVFIPPYRTGGLRGFSAYSPPPDR
jgi:hypothetical protein